MPRQVTGKFILSLVPQGDADSALALLNKPWGNSGSPEYIRRSFFSQQGDEIFLATSGNPYDDYVSIHGFRFISRPMQNERDETLGNFVISNINEAVTLMDQDRNIVYINDGFTRIFSYTREEVVESSIALLGSEKSMSASV